MCDRPSLNCGAASRQLWPMQHSSLAVLLQRAVSDKQVLCLLLTLTDLTLARLRCIACRLRVCSQSCRGTSERGPGAVL